MTMLAMSVILEEPAWPDLADKMDRVIHLAQGTEIAVTGLDAGMVSGKPSVTLRLDLPDGSIVIAETSMALWLTATDMLRSRYGDPRT